MTGEMMTDYMCVLLMKQDEIGKALLAHVWYGLSVATTKNTVTKWDILLPVGILTVVTEVF
jgi:hypothetical protein